MKEKSKKRVMKPLKTHLILLSLVLILYSVIIFIIIEYIIYVKLGRPGFFSIVDGVGMVVPMALILAVISWMTIRKSYKYLATLIQGIKKVANGDFNVSLNSETSGVFKEVYKNFNTMVVELKNTQTLREDFINFFSHEFKTPIMSINGFATLLLKLNKGNEEEKKYLEIISSESKRLAELSTNSLILTKLESKAIQPLKSAVQIDEQIRECVILLSPLWMNKKIDLTAELFPVQINASRELLHHVWINLLSNAIKFTPENGTIKLNLTKNSECCIFLIEDSGMGIREEEITKIFTKFYKGNNKYMSSGLGLGLSIVKKVLDITGGTIEVKSTLGRGTVFMVTIPF